MCVQHEIVLRLHRLMRVCIHACGWVMFVYVHAVILRLKRRVHACKGLVTCVRKHREVSFPFTKKNASAREGFSNHELLIVAPTSHGM